MNGLPDLTDILRDWEYDEDSNVRFLSAADGRDLMQIRQPMGIEQYDLDGRPDGRKPQGEESWLNHYLHREQDAKDAGDFLVIDEEGFERLRDEGVLYYYRYLALFQVGQYERVSRDTDHNLEISYLLERCYRGENRKEMLQYRPYIRRINAISKAMVFLANNQTVKAMEELDRGMKDIETLEPVSTTIFEFEKIRSLQHLTEVISQIREAGTVTPEKTPVRDRLNEELSKAVDAEDYERAARLRDRLRRLG
jgi:hypothetical protein